MRKTQEEHTWDSLNKEYQFFQRCAARESAPKVESDYYASIANRVRAKRDSIRFFKKNYRNQNNQYRQEGAY
jgi:hypothetical protein